jgi:hypothetical protein
MSNLIIVAAGKGERLGGLTRFIPKPLICLGNENGIDKIISFWAQKVDRILIIVHKSNGKILQGYCEQYFPNIDISFRFHDQIEDSTDAKLHQNAFGPFKRDVFISWCDLIPTSDVNISKQHNVVFTSSKVSCRYAVRDSRIVRDIDGQGNVIGIYYVKDLEAMPPVDAHTDFVESMAACEFETCEIGVVDFGDLDKLYACLSAYPTRFFNRMDDLGDRLRKVAVTGAAKKLIRREQEWYRSLGPKPYVPKIYMNGDDFIEMEKLNARPIYKVFDHLDADGQTKLLRNVLNALRDLHYHRRMACDFAHRDIRHEYVAKTEIRLAEMAHIIPAFDMPCRVNLKPCQPHSKLLKTASLILTLDTCLTQYSFIHGDPQFSNLLVDDQLNIFMVDPRGYFGQTELMGLEEYDLAKLLYALNGYDLFNLEMRYSLLSMGHGHVDFKIPGYTKKYDHQIENVFTPRIKLIHAIIWLSLTTYIKNDINKAIATYWHGVYLLQDALDEIESIRI